MHDLEGEICQTFQIVGRRVARTNKRVEFARNGVVRLPLSGSEGRDENWPAPHGWMFI